MPAVAKVVALLLCHRMRMCGVNEPFWAHHPGLVWSNSAADDSVRIPAALMRPRFRRLLDIVCEFGLERVQREWKMLACGDGDASVECARVPVERILRNIEKGFSRADAGS